MEQILSFVYHILIFNIIKPLPCSSSYFNHHFKLSSHNYSDNDSHYRGIVRFGKERFGLVGVLFANIGLMFFCLPLCFLADWAVHIAHSLWLKIAINASVVLMMLEKFDMLTFSIRRNYLKLLYLIFCIANMSYWTLTCMFLLLLKTYFERGAFGNDQLFKPFK